MRTRRAPSHCSLRRAWTQEPAVQASVDAVTTAPAMTDAVVAHRRDGQGDVGVGPEEGEGQQPADSRWWPAAPERRAACRRAAGGATAPSRRAPRPPPGRHRRTRRARRAPPGRGPHRPRCGRRRPPGARRRAVRRAGRGGRAPARRWARPPPTSGMRPRNTQRHPNRWATAAATPGPTMPGTTQAVDNTAIIRARWTSRRLRPMAT